MKQKLSFFLLLCVFFPISAESILSSWQAPLAKNSLLLDIEKVTEHKVIAVGERGHILLSTDGDTWQQVSVPTRATLTSVYFLNESLGWAVGHDATILHSTDGGLSWQVQQQLPELEKPLFDIAFKDKMHGIAVGAYGLLFRTSNGGKSWQSEFHDELLHIDDLAYLNELKLEDEEAYLDERDGILPHFNRIEIDGRTLYLAGEIGLIAKSNDFGKHWHILDNVYHGSFFDIVRTQQGNLVISGLRGNVFRSLKNGTPWQPMPTNTTALLNSIVLADDNTLYILGNNGVLLRSHDDAQTFTIHIQKDGKALIDGVWYQNKLIVVSENGIKHIKLLN